MSPGLFFFIISYGSFQHLNTFRNSPKYRAKIVVIFSQLLSFHLNYCLGLKLFRKSGSFSVIPRCDKILHDIFWQFVEIWNLFLEYKKNDVENLKNLFLFHGLLYDTFKK